MKTQTPHFSNCNHWKTDLPSIFCALFQLLFPLVSSNLAIPPHWRRRFEIFSFKRRQTILATADDDAAAAANSDLGFGSAGNSGCHEGFHRRQAVCPSKGSGPAEWQEGDGGVFHGLTFDGYGYVQCTVPQVDRPRCARLVMGDGLWVMGLFNAVIIIYY